MVTLMEMMSGLIDCGRTADVHHSRLRKVHIVPSQPSETSMMYLSRDEKEQTPTSFGQPLFAFSTTRRLL